MSNKPNANAAQIGMWNSSIVADYRKIDSFNRQPIEVTKDQVKHLYLLLYPFVSSEFVHRSDMQAWAEKIMKEFQDQVDALNKQLKKQQQQLDAHTHLGNMGFPTSNPRVAPAQPIEGFVLPELNLWTSKPEDDSFKFGESLVIKAVDSTPSLQQRNATAAAQKVVNTSEELKIENQIDKGSYLTPFDVENNNIDEPNTFSI